jgi:hypothetical protein
MQMAFMYSMREAIPSIYILLVKILRIFDAKEMPRR